MEFRNLPGTKLFSSWHSLFRNQVVCFQKAVAMACTSLLVCKSLRKIFYLLCRLLSDFYPLLCRMHNSTIEDSTQPNVFKGEDTLAYKNLAAFLCFSLEQKLVLFIPSLAFHFNCSFYVFSELKLHFRTWTAPHFGEVDWLLVSLSFSFAVRLRIGILTSSWSNHRHGRGLSD